MGGEGEANRTKVMKANPWSSTLLAPRTWGWAWTSHINSILSVNQALGYHLPICNDSTYPNYIYTSESKSHLPHKDFSYH